MPEQNHRERDKEFKNRRRFSQRAELRRMAKQLERYQHLYGEAMKASYANRQMYLAAIGNPYCNRFWCRLVRIWKK